MKQYSKAKRIKAYSHKFALYRVDDMNGLNFVDSNGKQLKDYTPDRNVIGVDDFHFTGWAKGKTGHHRLNEENTEEIIVGTIRVLNDSKMIANDWQLVNQDEINELYSARVAFNI